MSNTKPATLPNNTDSNKASTPAAAPSTNKTTSTTAEPRTTIFSPFSNLATEANLRMLFVFLGVYFIIYFVLGKFFDKGLNPSGFNMNLSRSLDMLFLVMLVIITYSVYQSHQKKEKDVGFFKTFTASFVDYINKPLSIFTTIAFLIMFYVIAYLFRIPMDSLTKPVFMSLIEVGAWLVFIIILFIVFFKYVLGISFFDLFPSLVPDKINPALKPGEVAKKDDNSKKDDKCKTEKEKEVDDPNSEVFNVANNLYTYEDAQAICKAYDAKLATYDQIEKAYNNGAEWCNYGWSAGQMILFPTQKKTWEKLQKDDENMPVASCANGKGNPNAQSRKNNCGRPGVNGGYIANPYVRFGVNCFGKKPPATDEDRVRMNAKQNKIYPKTPAERVLEKKVDYWKENADKLLQLNSYSTTAWNKAESSTK
jgi:hypothetical protein